MEEEFKKNLIVYTLSSSEEPYRIRYVGITTKGVERRLKEHLWEYNRYNTHKNIWIRSVRSKGYYVIIEEHVSVLLSESDLFEVEKEVIAWYRSKGYDLVNATDGGEFVTMTPEIRKKISDRAKGRIVPDDVRKRISLSSKGKPVLQYCQNGTILNQYPNLRTASRETGICVSGILKVCKGNSKHSGGYIWKYLEETP